MIFPLIELQENEQGPFSGYVLDCKIDGASFLHGIFPETSQAKYFGILIILQGRKTLDLRIDRYIPY
jgi:hypothetical protein